MSHNNPQRRARGGRTFYAGASSGPAKEQAAGSERFKKGGRVAPMAKEKSVKRPDKFARGGSVKANMSSAGGGSADKSPFSSAK